MYTIKFPDSFETQPDGKIVSGNYKTAWILYPRMEIYDNCWRITGFGNFENATFGNGRLYLCLDSKSEISNPYRTWKYEEFGRLAIEFENRYIEQELEKL